MIDLREKRSGCGGYLLLATVMSALIWLLLAVLVFMRYGGSGQV